MKSDRAGNNGRKRKLPAVLFTLSVLLIAGAVWGWQYLPSRFDPFQPLSLSDETSFLTPWKLSRLSDDPERCASALRTGTAELTSAPISSRQSGCGASNAYRLIRSEVIYGGDVRLACPTMVSLLMWERHVARPAARDILNTDLSRVRHYGTYSCRNVNNAESGRLSRHATASAIDIAGFEFEDGRRLSVAQHWEGEGEKALFLRRVHQGACDLFGGVLGPEYNDLHKDHFHFETGDWGFCR